MTRTIRENSTISSAVHGWTTIPSSSTFVTKYANPYIATIFISTHTNHRVIQDNGLVTMDTSFLRRSYTTQNTHPKMIYTRKSLFPPDETILSGSNQYSAPYWTTKKTRNAYNKIFHNILRIIMVKVHKKWTYNYIFSLRSTLLLQDLLLEHLLQERLQSILLLDLKALEQVHP